MVSHRILAMNRGEKESILSIKIDGPDEKILDYLKVHLLKNMPNSTGNWVELAIKDAYKRLIFPSVEREIRNLLTLKAEQQAMRVFSKNLKQLLLQPPLKGKCVLGWDPAYRTGCKLAVVDDTGKVLNSTIVYPTPPQNKKEGTKKILSQWVKDYAIDCIAIGNGTASRESEQFLSNWIKESGIALNYLIVNEAGASVYSASKLASQEFPTFDVGARSAISIARRIQDPLAELVKIDPKAVGVGQYQHDLNQKKLSETLESVVEACVNRVGVDLNTASESLLNYVAGLNKSISKNIVAYREKYGKFTNRQELKTIKNLGEKAFKQCAGFLRINESECLLDRTAVHPESYGLALRLLQNFGINSTEKLTMNDDLRQKLNALSPKDLAKVLDVGWMTLDDVIREILKPGRDPRDEMPKPILLKEVLEIDDLKNNMTLRGTVRNVSDFGAFVDIGVHQDGLVHISELSNRYVKDPLTVVSVGDIVTVKVLDVDKKTEKNFIEYKTSDLEHYALIQLIG